MCERDIPSPVWRKGWAVRAAHKKRTSSITRTHSLQKGKQRETKCQETSVSELTKKEGQETSVSELTKREDNFWSGQVSHYWRSWWVHFSLDTDALSSTPIVNDTQECQYQRREINMIHCQDDAKRIHVKCPMPYKSNIRSQRCLLKKVWVLFFFFCFVSISFAFYFLFWYAQTRAPFFYCLFAFVLIFYCFFCL